MKHLVIVFSLFVVILLAVSCLLLLSRIGSLSTTGTQNVLLDRFTNLFFRFNTSTDAAYNRGRLILTFSA